jgi:ATP/maltotriose-dependent transcriptional regulator MalT
MLNIIVYPFHIFFIVFLLSFCALNESQIKSGWHSDLGLNRSQEVLVYKKKGKVQAEKSSKIKLLKQEFNLEMMKNQKELELNRKQIIIKDNKEQLKFRMIIGLIVLTTLIIIIGFISFRILIQKYNETKDTHKMSKKKLELLQFNINSQLKKEEESKMGFVLNGKLNSWLEIPLSIRELDVLGELTKGLSNKHIGEALFISENTVRSHLSKIYEKLYVQNRVQAINLIDDYRTSSKTNRSD